MTDGASAEKDKLGICKPGRSEECKQIPLTIPIATQLLKNLYTDASYETEDAFYDIRCIWNSEEDELSRKLGATNRLFIYYLLILAMYIIQICFLIDEKLVEGLCRILGSLLLSMYLEQKNSIFGDVIPSTQSSEKYGSKKSSRSKSNSLGISLNID